MKDGFLNYLEEFDTNQMNKKIEEKKQILKKEPKILALKVEIASIEGANVVIEKIQDWISKQQPIKENIEIKKPFKIPPKKEIINPILESKNRAISILDGLPDDNSIIINEESIKNSINISESKNFQQNQAFESVANHASALL